MSSREIDVRYRRLAVWHFACACTLFLCKICTHIGPITIGYELMVYPTTESNGFVEICAVITQPSDGIAPREFVVSSRTRDGTASKKLPIHMEQECIC